jgi:hypothetical protein
MRVLSEEMRAPTKKRLNLRRFGCATCPFDEWRVPLVRHWECVTSEINHGTACGSPERVGKWLFEYQRTKNGCGQANPSEQSSITRTSRWPFSSGECLLVTVGSPRCGTAAICDSREIVTVGVTCGQSKNTVTCDSFCYASQGCYRHRAC